MSADGVIQIDLLLKGKDQFVTDAHFIDDLLEHLGLHTAKQMDESFRGQTEKVVHEAKDTKEKVQETVSHPYKFTLSAQTEEANAQIAETKEFLKGIPKHKLTTLKANTEAMNQEVQEAKEKIDRIPKSKKTKFDADTDNFTKHLHHLRESTTQTESHFSHLKEIMVGTFAGSLITSGIQGMVGGLKNAAEAGMEYNKEQDTMKTVWKALTEETPKDGQKLVGFINDISNHSVFTAESINKMAQSFYHVHSNTEETERWTNSLVALGSTLHMTNDQVSEAGEMFAKVMASGKAGAQDIYMMINRFPMFGEALQEVTGKTMEDLYALSAQGKLTSESFGKAMDYLGKKYKDGTEEAMTSMQGMSMYIGKRWQQLWGEAETTLFASNKRISKSLENLLSDKQVAVYANALSGAFSSILGWVTNVMDYIDKHKTTLMDIIGQVKTILGIVADTAWQTFKAILSDISALFLDTAKHGEKAQDPLSKIDVILKNIAKNKETIKNITKLALGLFAIGKAKQALGGVSGILLGITNGFGKLTTNVAASGGGMKGFLSLLKPSPFMLIAAAVVAVGVAFYEGYKHSKTFRDGVNGILSACKKFGKNVYDKYIGPAIHSISKTFSKWGKQLSRWWDKNGVPLEHAVKNFAGFLGTVFAVPLGIIKGIFTSVWAGIIRQLEISWDTIKTVVDGGVKIVEGILDLFIGIFTGNWSKAWDGIQKIFFGGLEIIGGLLKGAVVTLGNIAVTIGEAIGNAVIGGINGVIDGVDWISEKLTGHKTKIHHVDYLNLVKLEKGTDHHTGGYMMVNDQEGPVYEELIIPKNGTPYIPKGRNVVLNEEAGTQVIPAPLTKMLTSIKMLPRYENGTGFWTGLWESAKDLVGDVMDYATHPSKLVNIAINKFADVKSNATEVVDIGWGSIKYLAHEAVDWVKSLFSSSDGGGKNAAPAGAGVNRWKPQLVSALRANHLPTSDEYVNAWLRQIQTESGGNEHAVQGGYTDINTLTGDLAKGLLQTISATFNAYAFPGHHDIFNGYDNMLAAISYTKARYGSDMLAVIGHGHGYANGGWAKKASVFGEVPGEPEVAINPKRDSADQLIEEVIDVRSKVAPNSLTAKMKHFMENAKSSMETVYHDPSAQSGIIQSQQASINPLTKGDIHLEVKLDNGEIFRQQIPLHQAYQSNKITIEQNKLGGELLW